MRAVSMVPFLAPWFLLAVASALAADDIEVRSAFSLVELRPGDEVHYTITLAGTKLPRLKSFPRPNFSQFELLGGPSSSTQTQMSISNGRTVKEAQVILTWLLRALDEGTARVPSLPHSLGGKVYRIPAASIKVKSEAAQPPPKAQGRTARQGRFSGRQRWEQEPEPARSEHHLRVKPVIDSREVWVGEEFVLTHVLEFDVGVDNAQPAAAEFPGFQKTSRKVTRKGRTVSGKSWQEAPLERWCLVPLAVGERQLPSLEYTLDVRVQSRDPFASFFGGRVHKVVVSTAALPLLVKALPPGAPASFSGAVGSHLNLHVELMGEDLSVGDGATLSVEVRGIGNFASVSLPSFELPPGLKSFDPQVREETRPNRQGLTSGAKVFEFPVLVNRAGQIELPSVEWTYFDTDEGKYVTRRTRPLVIHVAEGEAIDLPRGLRKAVTTVDEDILHVRSSFSSAQASPRHQGVAVWFWPLLLMGPGLFAITGLALLGKRLVPDDPARARARSAHEVASGRLVTARSKVREGEAIAAADAAASAVAGLVTDRLGLGVGAAAPAELAGSLAPHVTPELASEVKSFLGECDLVRFAPEAVNHSGLNELVSRAGVLVKSLSAALPMGA